MQKEQLHNVNFDIIRYANCWEDADILLEGLAAEQNKRILSIGSAGDNSFSLLITNPEKVVVVDISKVQLYLIELKKAAFFHLTYPEFLGFLGFREWPSRIKLFTSLKNSLSEEAQTYWETHIQDIAKGVIYMGKFENYFRLFRTKLLPIIHSGKTVDQLFEQQSAEDQNLFYKQYWNNWRWKLLFRIFFSKPIMGRYGRDPEFLKHVEVPVSQLILKRTEKHLKSEQVIKNHFLHFIVKGYFNNALPHYVRKENFDIIKENLHKLILIEGFAEDGCKLHGKFHYFNLSNIFEYMDEDTFKKVSKSLILYGEDKAKYAYWNLMVPRDMSAIFPHELTAETELSEKLTEKDKCFFYSKFQVCQSVYSE